MKRQKKLTKRERKSLDPRKQQQASGDHQHIHCIACGRHLDAQEFSGPAATARIITCAHGSRFPSCVACATQSQLLVDAHDRTNQPVKTAQAWH
jgi:hypothetical protein